MTDVKTSRPQRSQRGADKVSRIPVKVEPTTGPLPRKPPWLRVRAPSDPRVQGVLDGMKQDEDKDKKDGAKGGDKK